MTKDQVGAVELRFLVLREAIQPVVRLARISGMSLDDLNALVSNAYYREFRERGHSHQMMARRIGKSLRSVASLAKKDKASSQPLAGSQLLSTKRAIATRVGKSPICRAALIEDHERRHRTSADHDTINAAIDQLLEEGILSIDQSADADGDLGERDASMEQPPSDDETLQAGANFVSLQGDDAEHRLASLRHLLLGAAEVIYQRFFLQPDPDAAFARVLSFRVRHEHLDALAQRVYADLRAAAVEEDEASTGDETPVTLTLTLSRKPTRREW